MNEIKIGIVGLGSVGQGVLQILEENLDSIESKINTKIKITGITAKNKNKKRDIKIDNYPWFDNPIELTQNPEVDVLIELVGGEDGIALKVVETALKEKKHVITANKALIAKHGNHLINLAEKNNVKILFEAAVAGAIPIIKTLKESTASNSISAIYGILNGTCNYILTSMERDGANFNTALKSAQDLGFAESDPTFDIEGMDAAHKIGILSALAFGTSLPPQDFYVEGITKIEKSDFKYAMDMGYTVKHLAVAKVDDNLLELRAHPALIKLNSHLANLKGVRNGMEIDTDLIGKIHIAGSGAGQESTASGLISDLVNLANSKPINENSENNINTYEVSEFSKLVFQYYFYIKAEDKPGVMASITSLMASKKVGIESIVQKEELDENCVPIILITDPFKESDHSELHKELLTIESVKNIRSIRIEPN